MTTITGPNDAAGVVWAIGECFFFSFVFFYILTIIHYIYRLYNSYYTTWRGTGGRDDDNGPKRLVWALGEWVFFFFVFFYILSNIYSVSRHVKGTEGLREGGDDDNGPKRRVSRRLGH